MKNNKSRLKYCIKSILSKKYINKKLINICKNELEEYLELIGEEDYFYSLFSAKLYLKLNDIERSIKYAEMAQKIDDTKPSLYFLKFKIDINNRNYESAYNNLKKYEQILKSENKQINLSIYFNLLSILLKKEEYKIYIDDMINVVKIDDTKFLNLWKKFGTYLIVKDYDSAKLSLNTMLKYLNDKNLDIKLDFNELIMLLDNLKTDNKNTDFTSSLIIKINELLDNDEIELADNYFELLSNLYINLYKDEINLLKNKINEKKIDKNISSNPYLNEYRRQCFEYGRLSGQYEDYYNALNYFTAAYYVTSDPIFLYNIAKIYMISGEEEKAAEYFEKYIKEGYKKVAKSYILLSKLKTVYNIDKRSKFMSSYRKTLCTISKITGDSNYYEKNIIKPNEILIENPFEENEDLDFDYKNILENFDKYSSSDKVIAIKKLYLNGYRTTADKLIKQYRTCIDSNDIQQLEKNKKLYIMKNK